MPKDPLIISERKKRAFLKALAKTGRPTTAARAAGYSDTRYLRRLKAEDEEFSAEWDEALNAAADMMEDEAVRRATEGVHEPVFHKGHIVGHKLNYSDSLMMFLLKGARPEKFRDNHVGAGSGNAFNLTVLPIAFPSTDSWQEAAGKIMNNQGGGAMRAIDIEPAEEQGSKMKRS